MKMNAKMLALISTGLTLTKYASLAMLQNVKFAIRAKILVIPA